MSTINIKYGKNYHIKVVGGQVIIEFTDNNKLFQQVLESNGITESLKVCDFCEEKLILSDGKFLKRVRDNLIISKT